MKVWLKVAKQAMQSRHRCCKGNDGRKGTVLPVMLSLVAGMMGFPAADRSGTEDPDAAQNCLKKLPLNELDQKAIKCNFFTQAIQSPWQILQTFFTSSFA